MTPRITFLRTEWVSFDYFVHSQSSVGAMKPSYKDDDDDDDDDNVWSKEENESDCAYIMEREDTFARTWPKLTAPIIFMLCQVAIALITTLRFFS